MGSSPALPQPILLPVDGVWPRIAADAFIAPGAVVAGDVEIGPGASVWFQVTLRGDVAPIRIGAGTNVQDGAIVHCDPGLSCEIAANVTIGHRAIVHGATVEAGATIGMGAIVLSGARIGEGAVVAAGALVPEGMLVPAGETAMGVPARLRGPLDDDRLARLADATARYVANGSRYNATVTAMGGESSSAD